MFYQTDSTRKSVRRKVVLAVTVIRRAGQERFLAHTLDVTENSARLGGLKVLLEPGEVIEIQRGAAKAKFQVSWMGAPGSAQAGQAGLCGVEPDKTIWGTSMPKDEVEPSIQTVARQKAQSVRTIDHNPDEKRWHTRFDCSGKAWAQMPGEKFPVVGTAKDISQGGVYVELMTPLPVGTKLELKIEVESVLIETPSVVRTSHPMVGMGLSFERPAPENLAKLARIIRILKAKLSAPHKDTDTATATGQPARVTHQTAQTEREEGEYALPALRPDGLPVSLIAAACHALANNVARGQRTASDVELHQLREAMGHLQQTLFAPPSIDLTASIPGE